MAMAVRVTGYTLRWGALTEVPGGGVGEGADGGAGAALTGRAVSSLLHWARDGESTWTERDIADGVVSRSPC